MRQVENIFEEAPSNGEFYMYNPSMRVAFRTIVLNNILSEVFCKSEGSNEQELSSTDDDYKRTFGYGILMTKKEYEAL